MPMRKSDVRSSTHPMREHRSKAQPAAEPMRVLMLDLWATVPYYTAYLSRALRREGVVVQVASITYYLDRNCFRRCGLRPQPGVLDLVGRLNLPRSARRILKLAEGAINLLGLGIRVLLRPPEVLHVQYLPLLLSRFPLDAWFVTFCRSRGISFVLTVHDLLPHDTGEAHRAAYALLYARADRLICHSPHVRARLEGEFGITAERIAVIPHGPFFFDLPPAAHGSLPEGSEVGDGQATVLWQGIIFPYKGVDLLLNAWQRVEQATGDSLCLVILGTGNPELLARLQAQAQQLGLRQVRFDLRFCSAEELVAAYRRAAMVVYPYRAITTSGALATGLSLGKAIVASRLPVFEEILRDGESALFADPSDPGELAAAILRLWHNEDLRERLEKNVRAMQFSERTWESIAQATTALYRSAAMAARSPQK